MTNRLFNAVKYGFGFCSSLMLCEPTRRLGEIPPGYWLSDWLCCQTTYSADPSFHSQRKTAFRMFDLKLKLGSEKVKLGADASAAARNILALSGGDAPGIYQRSK